eukprot:699958_1
MKAVQTFRGLSVGDTCSLKVNKRSFKVRIREIDPEDREKLCFSIEFMKKTIDGHPTIPGWVKYCQLSLLKEDIFCSNFNESSSQSSRMRQYTNFRSIPGNIRRQVLRCINRTVEESKQSSNYKCTDEFVDGWGTSFWSISLSSQTGLVTATGALVPKKNGIEVVALAYDRSTLSSKTEILSKHPGIQVLKSLQDHWRACYLRSRALPLYMDARPDDECAIALALESGFREEDIEHDVSDEGFDHWQRFWMYPKSSSSFSTSTAKYSEVRVNWELLEIAMDLVTSGYSKSELGVPPCTALELVAKRYGKSKTVEDILIDNTPSASLLMNFFFNDSRPLLQYYPPIFDMSRSFLLKSGNLTNEIVDQYLQVFWKGCMNSASNKCEEPRKWHRCKVKSFDSDAKTHLLVYNESNTQNAILLQEQWYFDFSKAKDRLEKVPLRCETETDITYDSSVHDGPSQLTSSRKRKYSQASNFHSNDNQASRRRSNSIVMVESCSVGAVLADDLYKCPVCGAESIGTLNTFAAHLLDHENDILKDMGSREHRVFERESLSHRLRIRNISDLTMGFHVR